MLSDLNSLEKVTSTHWKTFTYFLKIGFVALLSIVANWILDIPLVPTLPNLCLRITAANTYMLAKPSILPTVFQALFIHSFQHPGTENSYSVYILYLIKSAK